jgi:hypothetical protein
MTNNQQTIDEINATIKEIEGALKPGCEIGARDKATVLRLLQTTDAKKDRKFFKCRREHSDKILKYFVKDKGIPQHKFSSKLQEYIYIVY